MKNMYLTQGEETFIFMTRKDGSVYQAVIDTEDLDRVKELPGSWTLSWSENNNSFYVIGYTGIENGKNKLTYLHRWIMKPEKGMVVDHINHDTLNNRKSNLRVVNQSLNLLNRRNPKNTVSGVRGVYWCKKKNMWHVRVQFKMKRKTVGYYHDLNEAAEASKRAREEVINNNGFLPIQLPPK